jgi:hypothetical protein
LYLALELSADQDLTELGPGGGAGIGYLKSGQGCPGWMSGEGEIWARLHSDYSFAVQPVFVPLEEGMTVKSLDGPVPDVITSNYLRATPNPFNPKTQLSFGLKRAGNVTVSVYDLHGRLVSELYRGFLDVGHHSEEWNGTNSSGQRVSSGVYFARLKGADFALSQKVLLLK